MDLKYAGLFREVLRRLPIGVTFLSYLTDSGPSGVTGNLFTSVSLIPPLVQKGGFRSE
jgi:flavin reductase (DIM6/NTAB) family NADH-FMN oxidoreductase RutF